MLPRLQRVRGRAGQTPGEARRRVTELDLAAYAALRHRFHDNGAEPALLSLALVWLTGYRLARLALRPWPSVCVVAAVSAAATLWLAVRSLGALA